MIKINEVQSFHIVISSKGNGKNSNSNSNTRINSYRINISENTCNSTSTSSKAQPLTGEKKSKPRVIPISDNQTSNVVPDVVEIKMKDEHIFIPGVTDAVKQPSGKRPIPIYRTSYSYISQNLSYPLSNTNPPQPTQTVVQPSAPKPARKRHRNRNQHTYVYTKPNTETIVEEKKPEIKKEAEKIVKKVNNTPKSNKLLNTFGACIAILGAYFGYKYYQTHKLKDQNAVSIV